MNNTSKLKQLINRLRIDIDNQAVQLALPGVNIIGNDEISIDEINEIWGTRFGYDDWDEYDTPGNR